ncbi:cilia- and flagella-associated protein 43-like [Babylonia areolata]|uniref:cilia- and flagella-associated protein 43-like n=1 Tax=Babylonia areolata TaxID=304850 RepID=UPI003FD11EBA
MHLSICGLAKASWMRSCLATGLEDDPSCTDCRIVFRRLCSIDSVYLQQIRDLMDQLGGLDFGWVQGYSGQTLFYIDDGIMCYQCGKLVKFLKDRDTEKVFVFHGKGAGPFTVHRLSKKFAISECCIQPKIYIYSYPSLEEFIVLKDGASIEFQKLEFSTCNYLLSISGRPEFELIIWDYCKGLKLTSVALSPDPCTSVTFNPLDWQQICLMTRDSLTLLCVEQNSDIYLLQSQKVQLPVEEAVDEKSKISLCFSTSSMAKFRVTPSTSAIAGLDKEKTADDLSDVLEQIVRVTPRAQTWTPAGDIFVGCEKGHLLKVNFDNSEAEIAYSPARVSKADSSTSVVSRVSYQSHTSCPVKPQARSTLAAGTSIASPKISRLTPEWKPKTLNHSGSLRCLAFHRLGLFVVGEDGVVLQFDVSGERTELAKMHQMPCPITCLTFSYNYLQYALGSTQGSIFLVNANDASVQTVTDNYFGEFVGIGMLTASDQVFVTARDNGMLQVWSLCSGGLLSSLLLGESVSSLACSPLTHLAVAGSTCGYLYFVDFSNIPNPRIVHRIYLYTVPIKILEFDDDGLYLFTGGNDQNVFVLDGRPSQCFTPLGYVVTNGMVKKISTVNENSKVHVVVAVSTSHKLGCKYIVHFEIPHDLVTELGQSCKDERGELKDEVINKLTFSPDVTIRGITLGQDGCAFAVSVLTGEIESIVIPEKADEDHDHVVPLNTHSITSGHHLPEAKVLLSPHRHWLASFSSDGAIILRTVDNMDQTVCVHPFSHSSGGVRSLLFSDDCQTLVAAGYRGLMCCYKWRWASSDAAVKKAMSDLETFLSHRTQQLQKIAGSEESALSGMDTWTALPPISRTPSVIERERSERLIRLKEEAIEKKEIFISPPPSPPPLSTWLQEKEFEAFRKEKESLASRKKNLREDIMSLRKQIVSLIRDNEELPELEKLELSDFHLDVDQQSIMMRREEAELEQVHEDTLFNNLVNNYLTEAIKEECWNNMCVKGRSVKAFNSDLLVANFPLVERSKETLKKLETVTKKRQIELQFAVIRKKEMDLLSQSSHSEGDLLGDEEQKPVEPSKGPTMTGSLLPTYLTDEEMVKDLDLFYDQFTLHLRDQKIRQIVFIEDAIYKAKKIFNKQFDEVFLRKEQEIERIKEKNKRVSQILKSLERTDSLVQPEFSIDEKPEQLMVVHDSEITAEKWLSEYELKNLEEERKAKEELARLANMDNPRERALEEMMGGVLEISRDAILRMEIPMPQFMKEKETTDYTLDEVRMAQEYEVKVKELQRDRETYRKQLESELKKLQEGIASNMESFDEAHKELFTQKFSATLVVFQEELKVLRLRLLLLREEELMTWDRAIHEKMGRLLKMKNHSSDTVKRCQKQVDTGHSDYEVLLAEDKLLDKGFRREFQDLPHNMVDTLYRHFRKRPRVVKKGHDPGTPGGKNPNPFGDQLHRQMIEMQILPNPGLSELDNQKPDSCDPSVWQRLCDYRSTKLASENKIKLQGQVMADMQTFLQKRIAEDAALKREVDDTIKLLTNIREDQIRFMLDVEVQLLLKQGQVEVDPVDFVPSYEDCLLVTRSSVEKLNTLIRKLGEEKIAFMNDSKEYRKGIMQLEWEHKKMAMEKEDIETELQDIQFTKVTREVQAFLKETDYDEKKAKDMSIMEQTIALQKKFHEKVMAEKQRSLAKLEKTMQQRDTGYRLKNTVLADLNVTVSERRNLAGIFVSRNVDTDAEQRYRQVLYRRQLVNLAQAQAQEMSALRTQVERLRLRTFPCFGTYKD